MGSGPQQHTGKWRSRPDGKHCRPWLTIFLRHMFTLIYILLFYTQTVYRKFLIKIIKSWILFIVLVINSYLYSFTFYSDKIRLHSYLERSIWNGLKETFSSSFFLTSSKGSDVISVLNFNSSSDHSFLLLEFSLELLQSVELESLMCDWSGVWKSSCCNSIFEFVSFIWEKNVSRISCILVASASPSCFGTSPRINDAMHE